MFLFYLFCFLNVFASLLKYILFVYLLMQYLSFVIECYGIDCQRAKESISRLFASFMFALRAHKIHTTFLSPGKFSLIFQKLMMIFNLCDIKETCRTRVCIYRFFQLKTKFVFFCYEFRTKKIVFGSFNLFRNRECHFVLSDTTTVCTYRYILYIFLSAPHSENQKHVDISMH